MFFTELFQTQRPSRANKNPAAPPERTGLREMQCDVFTIQSRRKQATRAPSGSPRQRRIRISAQRRKHTATISRFSDDPLAEIFIDAAKPGSALAEHANDAAVLASLLLQNGVTAAKIIHSISGPLTTALCKAGAQ